jgi:Fungal specific transcription factor domain
MSLNMHPELQDRDMLKYVHHYDNQLAATLVWVDGEDNPWRKVILPLAFNEPSLLFSVLALAAEHLSKRAPDDSLLQISRQADAGKFRDMSLKLLARHLKHEMQGQHSGQHSGQQLQKTSQNLDKAGSAKSILATMLMLCQLEMVHSESMVWKIHLQASHTMIQRWLLTPSRLDMSDSDSRFLIKETFTINVFAATSSFSDDEEALAFEDADDHTLFSGFMTVIHDITRTERKIAAKTINFAPDLPLLERRLEEARLSTRQLAANYEKLREKGTRLDFDRVVDIFHHAGVIYAYQALAMPETARRGKAPHFDSLLKILHLLPASGLFAQDLAWPLFIASTECREREHERQWLQQKMEDSADATGFASCHEAWDFLQKWWDSEEDARYYVSWIGFARARAARGHTFLVI